jgi:hypothetical protein
MTVVGPWRVVWQSRAGTHGKHGFRPTRSHAEALAHDLSCNHYPQRLYYVMPLKPAAYGPGPALLDMVKGMEHG